MAPCHRVDTYRLEDFLGYVRLTPAWPAVLGQPLPPTVAERFDYQGNLVERRLVPPAVRVIYPKGAGA